ncbi:transmembrane and immunoglobulin domain-containing protein 2-like, partial [Talpa occidentalis]|uniref:transmembrane and immunoglobulin domain-containing protein 2-like n=1 Tax=Talpa occidentalis TaxID=50954 RepID=UPI0023F98AB4
MGSPGMVLVLLAQFWDLQGATGLNVQQQGPKLLVVTPGSQVTLTCHVTHTEAWEKIRATWTKDNVTLCQSLIAHNSTEQGDLGDTP